MPLVLDPGDGAPIDLDALVEMLEETACDPRDEEAFAELGPLLARLGRNDRFLSDLAIEELKARCRGQVAGNGYGPQVFLLRSPARDYVLRANFWPAARDAATRASGAAAFFYDMPHDHNFPFLTYGYLGPGYWSDYWERDPAAATGLPGEDAAMTFTGRRRLEHGQLMLYRKHRDVHRQLPPDSLSVSLNILGAAPGQAWFEQYRFDVDNGRFAEGLTVTPSEVLLRLGVHLGNGIDLAERFARDHPCARMRVTALDAVCSARPALGRSLLEAAADSPDRYVAGHAGARLAQDASGTDALAV